MPKQQVTEVVILKETPKIKEVFCNSCGQLRLWLRPEAPHHCGACASPDIITGPLGGTELPELRAQWRKLKGQ